MAAKDSIKILDPSFFRPEDATHNTGWSFRVYDVTNPDDKLERVLKTYKDMHRNQCVKYVTEKNSYWCQFNKFRVPMMEALDLLNKVVDESDPDTDLPNIVHCYQTAERIRKEHPDLDWFHLTGLIHDVGKVMSLYGEPQWSTVGDTFPVGCEFAPSIVHRESTFYGNPDINNEKFNTKYGMYQPECGLENVLMSWGHDEYMYKVLKNHGTSLPEEGLYIIRFHSFYPWHEGGDYMHLCNNKDLEMLPWIKEFQQFDLYTKREEVPDIEALKPYYQGLINKYCPGTIRW